MTRMPSGDCIAVTFTDCSGVQDDETWYMITVPSVDHIIKLRTGKQLRISYVVWKSYASVRCTGIIL